MIVVEQPLAGGADIQASVRRGAQARMGVLQDPPAVVEPVEERGPAADPLAPVQPLPGSQGEGSLRQMLGAEQLAADGAGKQILAGLGTAWDESERKAGWLER